MHCSVVCGVTLMFFVINISSSSLAINTAAYYQRCVITCNTLALLHRRPRWQHLPVAALTQPVKPDIGSESLFLPTPAAFDAPVRGIPVVGISPSPPFGMEKLEWCGYPMVKNSNICLFVSTWSTNVTNTQTDAQTHRHRITAYAALMHSIARQKHQ